MKSICIREEMKLEVARQRELNRVAELKYFILDELVEYEFVPKKPITHGPQKGRRGRAKRDWE